MSRRLFEVVHIFPSGEKSSMWYFAESLEEAIEKFRDVHKRIPIKCIHEYDEYKNFLNSHHYDADDDQHREEIKKVENGVNKDNQMIRVKNKGTKAKTWRYSWILGIVPIIILFSALYFMNKDSIYQASDLQSEDAAIKLAEKETGKTVYYDDLKVIEKSLKHIDADPVRSTFAGAKSAVEVTFIFEFEGEKYKITSIVEEYDGSFNSADWQFYKISSAKIIN